MAAGFCIRVYVESRQGHPVKFLLEEYRDTAIDNADDFIQKKLNQGISLKTIPSLVGNSPDGYYN